LRPPDPPRPLLVRDRVQGGGRRRPRRRRLEGRALPGALRGRRLPGRDLPRLLVARGQADPDPGEVEGARRRDHLERGGLRALGAESRLRRPDRLAAAEAQVVRVAVLVGDAGGRHGVGPADPRVLGAEREALVAARLVDDAHTEHQVTPRPARGARNPEEGMPTTAQIEKAMETHFSAWNRKDRHAWMRNLAP